MSTVLFYPLVSITLAAIIIVDNPTELKRNRKEKDTTYTSPFTQVLLWLSML